MSQSPPPPGGGYQPPPGGGPPPPGGLSSQDERMWAMLAHVGALVAAVIALAFLAPLLVLLLQGSKSAFVRRHAVESLNFQITLLIALAAGAVIAIVTVGLALLVLVPAGLVIGVVALIWMVMASVKANNGEEYRYPVNIRLVS